LDQIIAEFSSVFSSLINGFPYFISHFGAAIFILIVAVYIYEKITPYDELELVKNGNTAAAISLSGGIIGLALPLAFCLNGSVNLIDLIIWGTVILIVQIIAFYVANLVIDDLSKRIENNEIGPAILLFSGKIAVSMLNAAAVAI